VKVTVWVIGIGSGHRDQLTGEAVRAMNAVDLFLVADKGDTARDLAELRERLCEAVIDHDHFRVVEVEDPDRSSSGGDYEASVRRWHDQRTARYVELIRRELPDGGVVGFLVWGDPAFYDSTIRVAKSLGTLDLDLEVDLRVVPGISSIQLLAAAHRIVLNRIGQPIHLTTGRRLLTEYHADLGDVLVMLDGGLACADLVPLYPDLTIFWGAQLGLPDESLITGRLADVIDDIAAERARIRGERGWVLDTYLLRRESVVG
jgi:precorrin-6A synthase